MGLAGILDVAHDVAGQALLAQFVGDVQVQGHHHAAFADHVHAGLGVVGDEQDIFVKGLLFAVQVQYHLAAVQGEFPGLHRLDDGRALGGVLLPDDGEAGLVGHGGDMIHVVQDLQLLHVQLFLDDVREGGHHFGARRIVQGDLHETQGLAVLHLLLFADGTGQADHAPHQLHVGNQLIVGIAFGDRRPVGQVHGFFAGQNAVQLFAQDGGHRRVELDQVHQHVVQRVVSGLLVLRHI